MSDRNYLMPAQEKLEWVTPKISLMDAGDTEGKRIEVKEENGRTKDHKPASFNNLAYLQIVYGPS